jgi:hypothetical protein
MEDLTLPSEGGSLKKWVYCAPKPWPIPQTSNKKLTKVYITF